MDELLATLFQLGPPVRSRERLAPVSPMRTIVLLSLTLATMTGCHRYESHSDGSAPGVVYRTDTWTGEICMLKYGSGGTRGWNARGCISPK